MNNICFNFKINSFEKIAKVKLGLEKIRIKKAGLAFFFILLANSTHVIANENSNSSINSIEGEIKKIFQFEIKPENDAVLQKITLTEAIYEASRNHQLSSLKIIDSQGNPLPYEFENIAISSSSQTIKPILYPLFEKKTLSQDTGSLLFKYDQKNRLSKIENTESETILRKVAGYLIDLGENTLPIRGELEFVLSRVPETGFLRFDIDQSHDLKKWRTLSRNDVVAQLSHQGNQSQRNRVKISGLKARYLRLNLLDDNPAFLIDDVTFRYFEEQQQESHWGSIINAFYNEQEKAYIAKISSAVTYKGISFEMLSSPTILKGNIYSKRTENAPWRQVSAINLFKIKDGNNTLVESEVELESLRANQLKIALDFPIVDDVHQSLSFRLSWMPQSLLFFANGNAPYSLVIGDDSIQNNSSNQALLKSIKDQISQLDSQATVGKMTVTEVVNKEPIEWKTLGLWFVLILGVLVMAWMAKRLMKEV